MKWARSDCEGRDVAANTGEAGGPKGEPQDAVSLSALIQSNAAWQVGLIPELVPKPNDRGVRACRGVWDALRPMLGFAALSTNL